MKTASEAEAGPVEAREGGESGNDAFRISEPDVEGHCFIVALERDGHDSSPASGEAGRYAREGA